MSTSKRPEDAKTIVGIKVAKSKKNETLWYTYYCNNPFSDYELDNSETAVGRAVDTVSSNEDLGIKVGDVVEFNYGRAIGNFQPVKSVTLLRPAVERPEAESKK